MIGGQQAPVAPVQVGGQVGQPPGHN